MPAPVFDTQLAATLAGDQAKVSYQQLVAAELGVRIAKDHTYADWARRPLSEDEVAYALDDVRYLPAVYDRLRARLTGEGRLAWLADDFELLADPATYAIIPEEQFRRVKRASSLDARSLAVLRELAAWREREAQSRDLPRKWVMTDEALVEVARRKPPDEGALAAIRGVTDQHVRRYSRAVLEAVQRGLAVPEERLPVLAKRPRMTRDVGELADLASALIRVRAREHGIAPTLIATRDELERFVAGERDGVSLASGWRHTIVGAEIEALLDGLVTLKVEDDAVRVVPLQGRQSDARVRVEDGVRS